MERKGWLIALGAVLLIAAGAYVWWTDSRGSSPNRPVSVVGSDGAPIEGGGGVEGAAPDARGQVAGRRRAFADGGVAVVAPRTGSGSPSEATASGTRPLRGIPRGAQDENQSSGWRLGQARRRIAILQDRESVYQAAVDRFVAEGNEENAARQRVVLERVQSRLDEFREEEQELLRAAEADGTMGDVDTGYEEGEQGPREPLQGGTTAIR